MADENRIAELEAALAEARAEIDRLRKFERESEMLRDRVTALQQHIVSLRPPRVPVVEAPHVSGPPEVMTPSLRIEENARARAREKRERAVLGLVVLVAAALTAGAVYLDRALLAERAPHSGARGVGTPGRHAPSAEPSRSPSDGGVTPDAARDAP